MTALLAGALATWRATHLLTHEDGPGLIVARLRARAGTGVVGQAMDCFACCSIWVAAPVAVLAARRPREALLLWGACSGAACLLERGVPVPTIVRPVEGGHP